jgi:hypothetical protein
MGRKGICGQLLHSIPFLGEDFEHLEIGYQVQAASQNFLLKEEAEA